MNTKTCPTCGFLLSDEVVVIDKEKWDRLVELLTADLPWERHRIMDLIEEVGK